jgi:hypothetical protein
VYFICRYTVLTGRNIEQTPLLLFKSMPQSSYTASYVKIFRFSFFIKTYNTLIVMPDGVDCAVSTVHVVCLTLGSISHYVWRANSLLLRNDVYLKRYYHNLQPHSPGMSTTLDNVHFMYRQWIIFVSKPLC